MEKLTQLLKNLKSLGAVAVKQSLEDEGASFEDIKKMRKITKKAKLALNVKIGGCEAKNDIFFCQKIKVDSVVAPMVESQYALNKFLQIIPKNNKSFLYVNLESKTAFKNINLITSSSKFKSLKGIVVGRSDLAGSMGLKKKDVDSKKIFKAVFLLFKKIKKKNKNIICKMGGSLTNKSKNFINILFEKKLLDRVETRNVEVKLSKKTIKNFEKIIFKIFNFELEWLKYKFNNPGLRKQKSKIILKDYSARIKEIEKRTSGMKNINIK